jgi:hypothetical protein
VPREEPPPVGCVSRSVSRRGGNARHDAYATRVSGSTNDYFVQPPLPLVIRITYDGFSPMIRVWEVKVGHGWFFNPAYASLRDTKLALWDGQKNVGLTVAAACGYMHVWSIPDRYVAQLLNARWGGIPPVLNIPER